VLKRVKPEEYDAYHDLANRFSSNAMDLRQFRERLELLFKNYPDVLEILPNFFSDQTDLQIAPPI
jgi:histone deacetylase complex regulatory component SIN3